jgi:hypothetical protein
VTAKMIMTIEGWAHFDELAIRSDDAYVAADPLIHKSDIQEARIVLRRNIIIAPIYSHGVFIISQPQPPSDPPSSSSV